MQQIESLYCHSRNHCKRTIIPRPAPTLPKPHYPLLRTNPSKAALSPSLFVGERACSSRCTEYCHSHNHLKSTTIPCSAPSHSPPLSKGGGLTARHILLLCCFLLAICPPFLYCKLFCRQDGGIALHPPTLSKTALSLAPH